ncbi:MAG: hypothetical protein ACRC7O_16680, partial [Fimbriiglobus sp.]
PVEPPPPIPPARDRRGFRLAGKFLLALALSAGLIAGLDAVGRRAGLALVGRDRYAVRVADIACPAPPGSDRAAFLTEVRYLADFPETVSAVDPTAPGRLAAAFAKHPWVAAVTAVTAGPDPTHTIRVELTFRTPVLAVPVRGEPDRRAVDRAGILLPPTAPTAGLPELDGAVPPPPTPAGEPWPDADVKRAAELAAEFRPARIEKTAKGWRLTEPAGRVLVVGW